VPCKQFLGRRVEWLANSKTCKEEIVVDALHANTSREARDFPVDIMVGLPSKDLIGRRIADNIVDLELDLPPARLHSRWTVGVGGTGVIRTATVVTKRITVKRIPSSIIHIARGTIIAIGTMIVIVVIIIISAAAMISIMAATAATAAMSTISTGRAAAWQDRRQMMGTRGMIARLS
jgi:hypothetical protein